jgi:hypothetical protein
MPDDYLASMEQSAPEVDPSVPELKDLLALKVTMEQKVDSLLDGPLGRTSDANLKSVMRYVLSYFALAFLVDMPPQRKQVSVPRSLLVLIAS